MASESLSTCILRRPPCVSATNSCSSEARNGGSCVRERTSHGRKSGRWSTNPQATYSSMAIRVPKGYGFQMIADYPAVNKPVEEGGMSMPRYEETGMLLGGAAALCTLDMIQGYFRRLLCLSQPKTDSLWSPLANYIRQRGCHNKESLIPLEFSRRQWGRL